MTLQDLSSHGSGALHRQSWPWRYGTWMTPKNHLLDLAAISAQLQSKLSNLPDCSCRTFSKFTIGKWTSITNSCCYYRQWSTPPPSPPPQLKRLKLISWLPVWGCVWFCCSCNLEMLGAWCPISAGTVGRTLKRILVQLLHQAASIC